MDIEYKEPWVQALRSGNYKQGKYSLRNGSDEFCCLGVLCDVNGLKIEYLQSNNVYRYFYEDSSSTYGVPREFCKLIELDKFDEVRLGIMNDWDRETFETIANYIEENL